MLRQRQRRAFVQVNPTCPTHDPLESYNASDGDIDDYSSSSVEGNYFNSSYDNANETSYFYNICDNTSYSLVSEVRPQSQ